MKQLIVIADIEGASGIFKRNRKTIIHIPKIHFGEAIW